MGLATTCPVCSSTDLKPVFTLGNVPVICNQLWPDAEAARAAPAGNVDLVRCPGCAMIWNAAFEPERMVYAPGYENALHFSPRFRDFAEDLAKGLVERFDLRGKHVFEIGCGDGHMLDLMSKYGAATATGFDPSMRAKSTPFTARDGVEIIPEYFRFEQLDRPFDAILCRHVLEHLDRPRPLLDDIRKAIGDRDVPVYFEVPNAGWMLRTVSMWDVIYEHVGYWTTPSISTAFRRAGFQPVSVAEGYDGQFLMLEARPAAPDPTHLAPGASGIAVDANAFAKAAAGELSGWCRRLKKLSGQAVIWGAGSKGITFANALGDAAAPLTAMVDLNPRKHGLVAPGVALPIVAPEALREIKPALVLVSNALYEDEISKEIRDMGLDAEIAVIAG
ncbi:class I SAM-dependent methyltransferase [Frigidibacter sp. ROC022]|uniref:class I SAM-dependent methyltransferase n=1 Tax=Frigidibacter sp. ROC022 TaxID=2971796 RepID=UPI00215B1443|nr:class I SAM-dependent methyltransferase [Frigidibacter sp. ROC022]MCR8726839.1 class I SAM-dependent methyltransferase [Frigidibacter sp. ROC022]